MPNQISSQTVNLQNYSTPESFNPTTLYSAGDLGKRFVFNGKRYQIVQVDAASGTLVANGLCFWTSKSAYTVINSVTATQAAEGANAVAGRSPVAAAASSYLAIQLEGNGNVVFSGTTALAGDWLTATTGTTTSSCSRITAGTAPGYQTIGIVAVGNTTTPISVDLSIQIEVD